MSNHLEKNIEQMSLAEACYTYSYIETKLFDKVNEILGCDVNKCLEDNFVWGCDDVFWDDYDNSIEIIRNRNSTTLTDDEANEILKMGFYQIYETIGQTATVITKTHRSTCSPRLSTLTKKYKTIINAYKEKFGDLDGEGVGNMNPLPKTPPEGLLMSMALRYDHALGCPNYYDQSLLSSTSGITHQQKLDSTLSTMKKLYEEVAGYGFYSPEKEEKYIQLKENANK
jgi:hypothetical protein